MTTVSSYSVPGAPREEIRLDQLLVWADLLRIFGAFSVVVIHISIPITFGFGRIPDRDWFMSNVLESFFRSGIGIFLFLSGALLIPKVKSPGKFLAKRLKRILPPFLFWSLPYCYLSRAFTQLTPQELFLKIFNGAASHLWFIQAIILLYLVIAFVGPAIAKLKNYQLIMMLLFGQLLLIGTLFFELESWQSESRRVGACFLYMVSGYLLSRLDFTKEKRKIYGTLLFLSGALIAFIGTYYLSLSVGHFKGYFYSILSPIIMMKSAGAFLFFSSLSFSNGKLVSLVKAVAKTTFGVYLIHPIIRDAVLFKLGISFSLGNPLFGISFTAVLCFAISSLFFYFLSKFKYSNYLM